MEKLVFCPNHELEIYLYEYYLKKVDYKISAQPQHRQYYEQAKEYQKIGKEKESMKAYQTAKSFNPIDLEIQEGIIRLQYESGNFIRMKQSLDEMYPLIYTKRDFSNYLVMQGFYYLGTYQPEIAEVLDMYSLIFAKNSQAEMDLAYIEKAVKRKHREMSVIQMREFLEEHNIYTQPEKKTLELLYYVAKTAQLEGCVEYASQLETILSEWNEIIK